MRGGSGAPVDDCESLSRAQVMLMPPASAGSRSLRLVPGSHDL